MTVVHVEDFEKALVYTNCTLPRHDLSDAQRHPAEGPVDWLDPGKAVTRRMPNGRA